MRGRRVLIIVQNLSVPFDRRVWLECEALTTAGYSVSVICPKGPGERAYEMLDGVRIRRYRAPRPVRGMLGYLYEFTYCLARAALLIARTWAREGFDVVQACNPPDTYFLLAAPLKLFGKQFVYDQHDLCPELYISRFAQPSGTVLKALKLLERATYATADHVIVTNDSYRDVALTRGRRIANQVTTVRNGPDLRRLRPVAPQPALKAGRPNLCCYLGVMGPQDGVEVVLRAIDVIVHEMLRDDCHFALLGFGDCLDELRALTTELRLDPWVTFTGRADDTMIRAYLSTADVGLSPDPRSPFNTVSTMNKTMEYMAFGLPVVAFDLHETRVSAGAAAVYASTDDAAAFAKAICEVLDGPELRAELGRTARRRVQNVLAWEHQRAGYVAAYDELTGTTRDLDLTRVIDVTSGDEPVGVHGRPVGELDLQAHDTLGSGR